MAQREKKRRQLEDGANGSGAQEPRVANTGPFDDDVVALLRETRLRVLVTAMREEPRRLEVVADPFWRDLFGSDDEISLAAVFLGRARTVEEYAARVERSELTRPLAPRLMTLPAAPERWHHDLATLRAARCFSQVRRGTDALLARQQRATESWEPRDLDDAERVAEQLNHDAALLPLMVAQRTVELQEGPHEQGVDAAAFAIAALHRAHGDWILTATLVEQTAAHARWTATLGEASYYGYEGSSLRASMLSNAVLRDLGHPPLSEHPAVGRLVDAAAEWTADTCWGTCWQNMAPSFASDQNLREHAAKELRDAADRLLGERDEA